MGVELAASGLSAAAVQTFRHIEWEGLLQPP